jgi:hypothetical protein
MEIIGKWNIAEAKVFNAATMKLEWRTAADIMADEAVDDYVKQSLGYSYLFTEDGKAQVLMPIPANIPKEQIDAAIASGEVKLFDDSTMVLEEKAWKEEDGKLLFDTGAKGEVLGETVSPWVEIKESGNGIELMTYRLVKA